MKINRSDLYYFYHFEDYIKICCCNVDRVFSCSIYFFEDPYSSINWAGTSGTLTIGQENFILNAINKVCNTDFEFID